MNPRSLPCLAFAALMTLALSPVGADQIDEEVERVAIERAFAAQWSQAAVDALRARGDAESLALALLLAAPPETVGLAESVCTDDEALVEDLATRLEAERALVLASLETLPVDLRTLLVLQLGAGADAEERMALGARLVTPAPEDAAGWLVQLAAMRQLTAPPEEVDALIAAMPASVRGTSPLFHGYARRVMTALESVPPPATEAPASWADILGPQAVAREGGIPLHEPMALDDYRTMLAIGQAFALPLNPYQPLVEACDEAIGTASPRARHCEHIGRQLSATSAIIFDSSLGLAIWHRQVEGTPAEAEAVRAKREHHWIRENGSALQAELHYSPEGLRQLASLIRASEGDELELFRDLMRKRGIPLTPPREWMPANPAVLQARR